MASSGTRVAGASILSLLALLAIASLGASPSKTHAPAHRTGRPAAAHRATSTCGHLAGVFREKLEPVIEAVIDKRPERSVAASDSALAWWHRHSHTFGPPAAADSLLRAMTRDAEANQPRHAARLAVLVSEESLSWCQESLTVADRIAFLDLVGQTGWLRAHDGDLPWPDGTGDAVDAVTTALRAKRRAKLADSLSASVAATLEIPVAAGGDAATARRLLDLIDVVEKEVR